MEDMDLPPFVIAERDALLTEIQESFQGLNRQGGVSWSESEVLDMYGSPEEAAVARAKDQDTQWQDLLDDPDWSPDLGIGVGRSSTRSASATTCPPRWSWPYARDGTQASSSI